jgi:hypothetical protein
VASVTQIADNSVCDWFQNIDENFQLKSSNYIFIPHHQLRRAIDSIPTMTENVVLELAREDPEMKRNIQLWQV